MSLNLRMQALVRSDFVILCCNLLINIEAANLKRGNGDWTAGMQSQMYLSALKAVLATCSTKAAN